MSCYNSKIINAPADKVWAAISNFHNMDWAKGVIEALDVIGGKQGDQLGARRKLNGAFTETLVSVDNEARTFSYTIDDGPGPLEGDNCTGYLGRVEVHPLTDGDRTFVKWSSRWDTENGGVKELCDPIYQALLGAMAANITH
ncbi:MAG: SRPBCC family protein [bacterium]|nr:SRPBCC family protein [bacterium]